MKIVNKDSPLIKKYWDLIPYAFFGACTTVVNIVAYELLFKKVGLTNVYSTIVAWIVAVLFAFVTNKLWVFKSKSFALRTVAKEVGSFFTCRALTGLLDIAVMYVAVDLCQSNELIWKTISNIMVIVLNYIASKLIVFKTNKKRNEK